VKEAEAEVTEKITKLLNAPNAKNTPDYYHRKLGMLIWDHCGMARNAEGLKKALEEIPKLREEFWDQVKVPGSGESFNQTLERAGRVADFFELGELMCRDALDRDESAGCHFREEHVTEEGEAKRNDEDFMYVAAWEFTGDRSPPKLHKEQLTFEFVPPSTRSYK